MDPLTLEGPEKGRRREGQRETCASNVWAADEDGVCPKVYVCEGRKKEKREERGTRETRKREGGRDAR